ncbi:sigma-70 family RNA polymerase sigma factor [Pontixanthobacter aquaemixtae]|uniref:RNA polymerase sigma factor n=1 Tax=Pontixanthobacter aquaemixtae TaxID=1958940 RepID=A0A844ZQP9_9SPHN|nr:sigma-70 family RNA polymerase sigma factor [Pontixanthobacter aquaemixtae]MXO89400.1 sigma-70 family RNA polymerase sigma factor [Pontixanthobacter aquaemixtae]
MAKATSSRKNRQQALANAMTEMAVGKRQALDTVYELTSAKLFATIIRIARDRERAEDILQDSYVKIWRRADSFDPAKGSPIAWLCTIARNTALNEVRRTGRSNEISDDAIDQIPDDTKQAEDWLCDSQEAEALHRCLKGLQADHRKSILLAFFDGLSHSELAEKVDVPLGTLKSWIRRGLKGLKRCLNG